MVPSAFEINETLKRKCLQEKNAVWLATKTWSLFRYFETLSFWPP